MIKRKRLILSIDGGGIRGILPLMVLSQLNRLITKERIGRSINEVINFASGTSTGAIIAASLLLKNEKQYAFLPENILNLYVSKGPQIFDIQKGNSHKPQALNAILEDTFGGVKLHQIPTYFSFVSYDINNKEPFIFVNHNEQFREVTLAKTLAACSAIPGYFEPVQLQHHRLIDGIHANKNPANIAYGIARKIFPDDVLFLWSFGTGQLTADNYDEIEEKVDDTHESLLRSAEDDRHLIYHRFQPELLKADQAMDNSTPENIQRLIEDADHFLNDKNDFLKQAILELKNA